MLKERMQRLQYYGNSLPFAKVYFREDWEVFYFELQGKMFALMSPTPNEDATLTVKGLPEKNEELREIYEDISAGYHMNKKHWNSIALKSQTLSDEELEQMLKLSYELVWKNLPAKIRKELSD